MTEYDLGKVVGDDGEAGNGIASITKTGTSGLVDTYTITYDNGDTDTFTVTNGSNASVTIQTSWGSTTSDSKVPSEKLTKDSLDDKVSKSNTTGLLKNDGTVMTSGTGSSNYSAGNHTHSGYLSATKVTSWSGTVSDSNVPSEKLVKNSLDDKISKSSTTGLIKNDGSIDTSTYLTSSALSNYVQKSNTTGLLKNDGTVDTSAYITSSALSGYQTTANLVTSFSSTTSDSKYPSEKLTKTELDKKIAKSSTSGLVKNDGTIDTSSYITSSAISGMLTTSDVVDNLTSTSSTAPLSAKQGKALNDLIGDAITYINQ